jgi:hypothetical protein
MGSRLRSLFRQVRHDEGLVELRLNDRRSGRIDNLESPNQMHRERPAMTSHLAPRLLARRPVNPVAPLGYAPTTPSARRRRCGG